MSFLPTSIPTKRLASSITSTDMSFQLDDIIGWDGVALTAADFGTQAYCVFRNSNRTQMEIMEFNPATIASTSITISKRGLDFTGDPTTEITANKLDWTSGDTFVDLGTDTPQLWQWLKDYIDSVAVAGAPDASTTAKGLVEESTQAQTNAGTAVGETGARLFVNPSTLSGFIANQTNPIIRTYVNSGSPHTWSKPAGLKYIIIEAQGSGGNGATDGGGGGGGGFCKKVVAVSSLGSTETVTVGAGGDGSGNTTFGSHVTAGNGANASGTTGGSGGTATGGDININGQGGDSSSSSRGSGAGGNSFYGFGGHYQLNVVGTAVLNGVSGSGYGSGGSGGQKADDSSPSGGNGGSGSQGIVIVTEYYV